MYRARLAFPQPGMMCGYKPLLMDFGHNYPGFQVPQLKILTVNGEQTDGTLCLVEFL